MPKYTSDNWMIFIIDMHDQATIDERHEALAALIRSGFEIKATNVLITGLLYFFLMRTLSAIESAEWLRQLLAVQSDKVHDPNP